MNMEPWREHKAIIHFASCELEKYLSRLSKTGVMPAVVLGTLSDFKQNHRVPQTFLDRIAELGPEGFAVETVGEGERQRLLIGGAEPAGVLYGVYDFLETLGCLFRSSGDILPPPKETLILPQLSYRKNPLLERRGFYTHPCMPQMGLLSLNDIKAMLDQMAKMKFNTLIWFTWWSEPWLWYEYHGEPPLFGDISPIETGSMLMRFMGFYTCTKNMPVGADKFPHPYLASPEFQGCRTSRDLYIAARKFLSGLIDHAHRRNIQVWFSMDASAMAPNHGRFARLRPPRPFHENCGALGVPNDPVLREINRVRLQSLIDTYPEIDGCMVWLTEDYYLDPYPENQALYASERPKYESVIPLFKKHWRRIFEQCKDVQKGQIDEAIAYDIGNVEIIKDFLQIRNLIKPDLPLGVLSIGKGYLLPLLHTILPEEVVFADLESSGVWTTNGVPMELLGNMGNRRRLIVPRVDDDGSVVGLQFNATEFVRDRVIDGCVEYGASGFAAQMYRLRGSEHNSRFLAEAAWEENLTVPTFYHRYAHRIFGPRAADRIASALLILEENDKILGWRGQHSLRYDTMSQEMGIIRDFAKQINPFDGPPYSDTIVFQNRKVVFHGVNERLTAAQRLLEQAKPFIEIGSWGELEYLLSRLKVYQYLVWTIIHLNDCFITCREAFDLREKDETQFLKLLDKAKDYAEQGYQTSVQAAQEQSEKIDHPSELGVLAFLNSALIQRTAAFRQFMANLVEFHHGRQYWNFIPWGKLFPRRLSPTEEELRIFWHW